MIDKLEEGKIYSHASSSLYWMVKHIEDSMCTYCTIYKNLTVSNPNYKAPIDFSDDVYSDKYFVELSPEKIAEIKAALL